MQVDVRGGDLFVAQPEGDHGDVDLGEQQAHRRGVAQGVSADLVRAQRGTGLGGGAGVLGDAAPDRVAAECPAGVRREQRLGGGAAAFGEPGAKDLDGQGQQRGVPMFAAFTSLTFSV